MAYFDVSIVIAWVTVLGFDLQPGSTQKKQVKKRHDLIDLDFLTAAIRPRMKCQNKNGIEH